MAIWPLKFKKWTKLICVSSCTHIVYNTYFYIKDWNSFSEIHHLGVFPYKNRRVQIWPFRKQFKGQPRVIIWRNWFYLSTRCCIPSFKIVGCSVPENIFKRFLQCMGMSVILIIWRNFRSPDPWRRHTKFGFDRPSGFWVEDVWTCNLYLPQVKAWAFVLLKSFLHSVSIYLLSLKSNKNGNLW